MGGKGQRRREKNYKAAHGGYARLPPPPKPDEIDALPSKLRKLMDFTSPKTNNLKNPNNPPAHLPSTTNIGSSIDTERKGKKRGLAGETKPVPEGENDFKQKDNDEGNDKTPKHKNKDSDDEDSNRDKNAKRKAKRKRKEINDLRFEEIVKGAGTGLKRKERKKKYLEAKKNKHKKAPSGETLEFQGHEKIKFGEVVQAPPKLSAVPKASKKTVPDASHERLRLQAVEAYRNRKGWASRPGIQIPASVNLDQSL